MGATCERNSPNQTMETFSSVLPFSFSRQASASRSRFSKANCRTNLTNHRRSWNEEGGCAHRRRRRPLAVWRNPDFQNFEVVFILNHFINLDSQQINFMIYFVGKFSLRGWVNFSSCLPLAASASFTRPRIVKYAPQGMGASIYDVRTEGEGGYLQKQT